MREAPAGNFLNGSNGVLKSRAGDKGIGILIYKVSTPTLFSQYQPFNMAARCSHSQEKPNNSLRATFLGALCLLRLDISPYRLGDREVSKV